MVNHDYLLDLHYFSFHLQSLLGPKLVAEAPLLQPVLQKQVMLSARR